MDYKETVKRMTTRDIYDEIILHAVGDDWEGDRTDKCERELKILEIEFAQRMKDAGVEWE